MTRPALDPAPGAAARGRSTGASAPSAGAPARGAVATRPAQAPPEAKSAELRVSGLALAFGDAPVLSSASFAVERGAAVALLGANGSGKSTLLRLCLGLIEPDAGSVELLGRPLAGLGARGRRRLRARTALVAQRHLLVPRLSVLSNVVHGLLGRGGGPRRWGQALARPSERGAAMAALDRVGLAHLAGRRADGLSGGQSQRVAIARALVGGPRLLVADEPCASLDPAAGEEVMALLLALAREEGATVLFTTHDPRHALAFGDRVLGLSGGLLTLDAPAAALAPSDLAALYG